MLEVTESYAQKQTLLASTFTDLSNEEKACLTFRREEVERAGE